MNNAHQQTIHYYSQLGYIPNNPNHHPFQHMQCHSKYHKFFKNFGSWLPPILALIFVLSFELGHRKCLKDNEKKEVDIDSNEIIDLHGSYSQQQVVQHVIQVSNEVLGYGGQGTAVYKGVLDGRNVASTLR